MIFTLAFPGRFISLHFFLVSFFKKMTDINSSALFAIFCFRYTSGGTDTAAALGYARTTSFQTQNGMRENAAHIAVVVTDGNI